MNQNVERINHINYPDNNNKIYCRRLNRVITLDAEGKYWETCNACPLFEGDYQGQGVECMWDDTENSSGYCSDPVKEQLRVSKLIDDGVVPLHA